MFDSNQPSEVERAEKFGAAILELCVEVGGTVTGEHGVGIEKIDQMCIQFSREELDFFTALKRGFDPYGLLNPEKVIPVLARCAEYGKMHVHSGQVRFSDLPRF
jgi:glycolate oxidase